MLDLKDLDCLVALARHKHFARAAASCGISQPAFSTRIRNLEDRLNVQIVKRGNRFQGLTSEGELVVDRARGILEGVRGLEEETQAARGQVVGPLFLGVIPTASAYAAQLVQRLCAAHPGIRPRIQTTNALEIQEGVHSSRFDVGITYAEGVSSDVLRIDPLYDESFVLLAPGHLVPDGKDHLSWTEAAELPLILLEPEMQNRAIIDDIFAGVGVATDVVAETNGFIAAITMAQDGMGATVLPRVLVDNIGPLERGVLLPLVEPEVEKPVVLIAPKRTRHIPVVEALRQIVASTKQ